MYLRTIVEIQSKESAPALRSTSATVIQSPLRKLRCWCAMPWRMTTTFNLWGLQLQRFTFYFNQADRVLWYALMFMVTVFFIFKLQESMSLTYDLRFNNDRVTYPKSNLGRYIVSGNCYKIHVQHLNDTCHCFNSLFYIDTYFSLRFVHARRTRKFISGNTFT